MVQRIAYWPEKGLNAIYCFWLDLIRVLKLSSELRILNLTLKISASGDESS